MEQTDQRCNKPPEPRGSLLTAIILLSLVVLSLPCGALGEFAPQGFGRAAQRPDPARPLFLFKKHRKRYLYQIGYFCNLGAPLRPDYFSANSGRKENVDSAPSFTTVLAYLATMRDLCQRLHRHDLVEVYQDAWNTAALAVYGPLPARINTGLLAAQLAASQSEPETKNTTHYQREMRQKPIRKVRMRMDEYEILECGHKIWHPLTHPDDKGKRRRCTECLRESRAKEQKKTPLASTAGEKKGRLA